MFYKLMRNKNTILQFTITQILGNSGACVNSVYQAVFLSGLESRLLQAQHFKLHMVAAIIEVVARTVRVK